MLGFVGVVIVLGPWSGLGGPSLEGSIAVAGASICYGLSFTYLRRYVTVQADSSVSLVAGQLLCATAIMTMAAVLFTSAPRHLDGVGGGRASAVVRAFNCARRPGLWRPVWIGVGCGISSRVCAA